LGDGGVKCVNCHGKTSIKWVKVARGYPKLIRIQVA